MRSIKDSNITKKLKRQVIIFCLALLAAIIVTLFRSGSSTIEYSEHLDDVVLTVDDTDVTLRQMGYYIMKTEENIDELATVYDPGDTYAFWRVHTNGGYVIVQAKETSMNTCIRDMVYCAEAQAAGYALSDTELDNLLDKVKDTFDGLSYKQRQVLKYTEDELYDILYYVELASSYANYIVENEDLSEYDQTPEIAVDIDGAYYNEILKDHTIKKDNRLWAKVHLGNITITRVSIGNSNDAEKDPEK